MIRTFRNISLARPCANLNILVIRKETRLRDHLFDVVDDILLVQLLVLGIMCMVDMKGLHVFLLFLVALFYFSFALLCEGVFTIQHS